MWRIDKLPGGMQLVKGNTPPGDAAEGYWINVTDDDLLEIFKLVLLRRLELDTEVIIHD